MLFSRALSWDEILAALVDDLSMRQAPAFGVAFWDEWALPDHPSRNLAAEPYGWPGEVTQTLASVSDFPM